MALKIRLRRMGRKKAPHYRIVIAESTMPRDGRFVATIGHYNPTTNPTTLKVDRDKAQYWLGRGAVPTDTVQSLLRKAGVNQPAGVGVVANVTEAVAGAAAKAAGVVKGVAGKAGKAAASAAAAVADVASGAVEAARDAVESVAERVTGGDEAPAADAGETPAAAADSAEGAAATPAEETPAEEAPAADATPAEETPAEGGEERA